MEISMDPGAGAGVKGEYLQPASFFESMKGLIFWEKVFVSWPIEIFRCTVRKWIFYALLLKWLQQLVTLLNVIFFDKKSKL